MREIDQSTKYRIADLYQNTRMSIGAIAYSLSVSRDTVYKYKDLEIPIQRKLSTK